MQYLKKNLTNKSSIAIRNWGQRSPQLKCAKKHKNQERMAKLSKKPSKIKINNKGKYSKIKIPKVYDKQNLLKQFSDNRAIMNNVYEENTMLRQVYDQYNEEMATNKIKNTVNQLKTEGMIHILEQLRKQNQELQSKSELKNKQIEKLIRSPLYCKVAQETKAMQINKEQLTNYKNAYKAIKKSYQNKLQEHRKTLQQKLHQSNQSQQTIANAKKYQLQLSQQLNDLTFRSQQLQCYRSSLSRQKAKLQKQIINYNGQLPMYSHIDKSKEQTHLNMAIKYRNKNENQMKIVNEQSQNDSYSSYRTSLSSQRVQSELQDQVYRFQSQQAIQNGIYTQQDEKQINERMYI